MTATRRREAAAGAEGDSTPHALDSERVLLGAVVRGRHVDAVLAAINPEQLWRRDHSLILGEARALRARGVEPDARLVDGAIGAQLDSRADLYRLVDYSLGLTPSAIAEHARRIRETWAARESLRVFKSAGARLAKEPAAAMNGLPAQVAEQLEAIRRSAGADDEPGAETLPELLAAVNDAPHDMLVDGLLAAGEVAMLHGQPRDGKTWAALELTLAVATGTGAFSLDRLRTSDGAQRVLLVGNEDSRNAYKQRFTLLLAGRGLTEAPETVRLHVGRGVSLDDANWRARLLDEVRRDSIALLVIDPLRSVTAAADQGPAELRPVATYLRQVVETGCAVLVVHHDVKPTPNAIDARRRAQRASGGGLFSTVDAPIHVERLDPTRSLLTPDGTKHRSDAAPLVVERQAGAGWVRLVGETTTAASAADVALDAAVVDYLRRSGGGSQRAVTRALGRHHHAVRAALDRLLAAGVVDVAEGPRRAQLWCLR
jgi:hypothetical protein